MLEKLLKDLEKAAENSPQQSTKKILHLIIDEIKRQKIKTHIDDNNNESTASSSSSLCSLASHKPFNRADLIELNIGGTLMLVSASTLLKKIPNPFDDDLTFYQPNLLDEIASGQVHPKKDKNGVIFLDRNPFTFQKILDYLRSVNTPSEPRLIFSFLDSVDTVIVEAKYFRLESLVDAFGLHASRILKPDLVETFLNLKHNFTASEKWRLIYQASINGFAPEAFLEKCFKKSRTLLVVKTSDGSVFGGYTELAWDQSENKTDNRKFIFGLVFNNGQKPFKTSTTKIMSNIVREAPGAQKICFGDDEILIQHDSDKNSSSYFNVIVDEPHYHTCRFNFQTADIEVFQRARN